MNYSLVNKNSIALIVILAAIAMVLLPFASASGSAFSSTVSTSSFVEGYDLAATLGISTYAAKKAIDIIATASTIWAIIGLVIAVIGSAGVGIGLLATAKVLVQKYGRSYATSW